MRGPALPRRQRGRAALQVAQRPLEGARQAGRQVARPLRPAAPEDAAAQLLALVLADVQEDVGPAGVGGAVRDVLQESLGQLAPSAQLLHLHVARAHHQRVVFAQLLVGVVAQQVGDGVVRLLPLQGEDLRRAQVVDFEQGVAVGERLRPVAAEVAPKGSRRVLEGLHQVETTEGHGRAGFGRRRG